MKEHKYKKPELTEVETARLKWLKSSERVSELASKHFQSGSGYGCPEALQEAEHQLQSAKAESKRLFHEYNDLDRRRIETEMLILRRSQRLATWASFTVALFVGIATIVNIYFALIIGSTTMSSEKINLEAEKAEVAKTIASSIKWCFPDKDRVRMLAHYVREPYFTIFHPDSASTIYGFDTFAKYAETVFMNEACQPKGSEIRDLKINLSKGGDVAWYSCILDDWGEWDGRPWNWKNTRWTGVLEKVDNKWLIAQMHFSTSTDAKDEPETSELSGEKEKP